MSTSPVCSLCGTSNIVGAKFCAKCGNPLQMVAQPPMPSATYPGPAPSFGSPPYNYGATIAAQNRASDIDRTKMGLLLILIGVVLSPVPIVGIVGGIIVLVGAILVIVGRKSFGAAHSRNTIWSIILYAIGIAVVVAGGVAFAIAVASAAIANSSGGTLNTAALSQSLESSFYVLLVLSVVGGAIGGLANVLFTYAIQKQTGRILLWAAFAAGIIIGIVNLIIILPLISAAVAQSFAGGTYNPIPFADLQSQLQTLGLLSFIPAIIYAGAMYLAWSRVKSGEIPGPAAQPTPMVSP